MEQNGMMGGGAPNMARGMQAAQPGNLQQQMPAHIIQTLRNTMNQLPAGWQQTHDLRERAGRVMHLVTHLRFLPNTDIARSLRVALDFELKIISESPDKETYLDRLNKKMAEIAMKRQGNAENMANNGMGMQGMNPGMGMMPNNMMNMQNMQTMQNMQNMQNLQGLQNGMPNGMNMNMMGGMPQFNQQQAQPFPQQMQRQMQAANMGIPQQQQQQHRNTAQAPNMNAQHQQQQMPQQNQMAQNPAQQPPNQNGQGGKPPPTTEEIMRVAQMMYSRTSEDKRQALRQQVISNSTEQQRQQLKAQNADPLLRVFMQRARDMLMGNNGPGAQANQSAVNDAQGNNQGQPDFSTIMGQQANALKSQESGGEVVPASNNANFNQAANMNQGINPQMLNNQGNPQGAANNNNNNHMQYLLQQRERQQRMAQSNALAQQQALAQSQNSQLRGQPGGLNAPNALNGGPPAQVNSPAMSMLNRPMVPPGQAAANQQQQPGQAQNGGQNQPNRMQGQPAGMNQQANQLLQHHQQMLNQNNGQGPPMQQNSQQHQQLMQLMRTLPPEVQQKLQGVAPQQAHSILMRMKMQQMQRAANGQGAGAAMQNNMPAQGGNPQQQFGNMQQNGANVVPGFNAPQPPAGQQQPGQDHQRMQQQMQQQQAIRQRAMDFVPFPKPFLQGLGIGPNPNINLWGELKRYAQQNQQVLPQGTVERINQGQQQYFETHPDEMQRAMQSLRSQLQNGGQGQQQGASNALQMAMQNGMPLQKAAPTAQMQGPGMVPRPMLNNAPPTAQDVQTFRERNAQMSQNMSDDQLKTMLMRRRMEANRQQVLQQNALQQAAMRNQQGQRGNVQQPGMPGFNPTLQQQAQRPTPQQFNQAPNVQQGQKRSAPPNDDVVEIPNPNAAQPAGFPAGFPHNLTKEQLDKLPLQARENLMAQYSLKQREALRKAQSGLTNNAGQDQGQQAGSNIAQLSDADLKARIGQMIRETAEGIEKGPAQNYDAATLEQIKARLQKLFRALGQIQQSFVQMLRVPGGETKVRGMMKCKILLGQNISNLDSDGNVVIRDYISLTIRDVQEMEAITQSYFRDLRALKEMKDRSDAAKEALKQPPPPQAKRPSVTAKGPTPTSATMAKQASQQGHARKASSSKVPPAPTDNKPFDWGAPSPHGVPKYDLKATELTPDKLKMPPTKKAKKGQADSATTTPAAQAATPSGAATSPHLGKTASPQQARKTAQHIRDETAQKEAEQKKFKCADMSCNASISGFDTNDELKKHIESTHQVITDPLAFLLDNAVEDPPTAKKISKPQVGGLKAPPRKDAQTPYTKSEVATPATPAYLKAKIGLQTTPTTKTAQAIEGAKPEETLREAMAKDMGFDLPTDLSLDLAQQTTGIDPDDAFMAMLESAALGNVEGMEDFADSSEIDNLWIMRPEEPESSPELTPSDRSTSQSSHSSDVSQTERLRINLAWDPFGNGDTYVPPGLQIENLGLGDGKKSGEEDVAMADAHAGETTDGTKPGAAEDDLWNWNSDVVASDWDTLFGANAGLEGGPQEWERDMLAPFR